MAGTGAMRESHKRQCTACMLLLYCLFVITGFVALAVSTVIICTALRAECVEKRTPGASNYLWVSDSADGGCSSEEN